MPVTICLVLLQFLSSLGSDTWYCSKPRNEMVIISFRMLVRCCTCGATKLKHLFSKSEMK
jgi:hypothetical protein